jgi:hypothetical protein
MGSQIPFLKHSWWSSYVDVTWSFCVCVCFGVGFCGCHKYNYNFQKNESIAFCELGAWFKYLYNG